MTDLLLIAAFLAGWLLLQYVLLPKMGVAT
jgi:hypothetical protein